MAKKNDDWRLQSNLKNKTNAQGTLFSGGASQMPDDKRYPRGYNPERQKAINEALPGPSVVDHSREHTGEENTPHTRRIRETIKRSSVPVQDVRGASFHVYGPDHWYYNMAALNSAKGTYQSTDIRYSDSGQRYAAAGAVSLRPEARAFTILHELGHHVSAKEGTEHSQYFSPRTKGEEEGFADHYAETHWPSYSQHYGHPDRFDSASLRGMGDYNPHYHQTHDRDGNDRREHFEAGYAWQRPIQERRANGQDLWHEANRKSRDARADRILQQQNEPMLPGLTNGAILQQAAQGTYRPPTPRAKASGQLPPAPPAEKSVASVTPIQKKQRGPLRRLNDPKD